ncbi:biotin-dependent carboxyltransferase family protein [Nocardia higoensis]|uniref:Biotin-dependent carboxyltransferase family protein n=1 Tax=Nocardia higoensis TaxID=228599 RepID=A0ABS0DEA9_9NOCA|nr:biotin-dependent carboxyltransferase family protein [Nocardia higoensis]MBF6356749.1 biotin-dependent carboxyltransferase family protein [Nocardia higoensis]
MMRVLAVGPATTVQDLGRPGWFDSGVGVAGAADRASLRLANRLVGNPEHEAALEVLLGGLVVRAEDRHIVAVTGACVPASVDGIPVGHASVLRLERGQILRLGQAANGLRAYVAIRGGVAVESVLGSRSRDTLAGIGPEPLRRGDTIPIGPPPRSWPPVDFAPVAPAAEVVEVHALPGPRADWFAEPDALFAGEWAVAPETDRVGARLHRLTGPPLRRVITRELRTEGMVLGAVQVPPSGEPVVFLADHPITGGYPVVAVVRSGDVDRVAQARPGQRLKFRRVP